jgi:hypothetical protein
LACAIGHSGSHYAGRFLLLRYPYSDRSASTGFTTAARRDGT